MRTPAALGLSRTQQLGSVDMLCRRCERRLWSPQLMKFWTPSRGVWGARRLGDLLCARCGALLPAEHVARLPLHGGAGIARTRWASHGAPTERNGHPHGDCHGRIALVHNGIVENADALRAALEGEGHRFYTDTDTEALAHLIEAAPGDTLEARVIAALEHVEGTYGLAVLDAHDPEKIVVARQIGRASCRE